MRPARPAADSVVRGMSWISPRRGFAKEDPVMSDLLAIALTIVFFAVAAAFTRGCEKLEREKD
jgi:hypothetical protein